MKEKTEAYPSRTFTAYVGYTGFLERASKKSNFPIRLV